MPPLHRPTRWAAGLVAVLLVVACGSDDGSGDDPEPTATTTDSTTSGDGESTSTTPTTVDGEGDTDTLTTPSLIPESTKPSDQPDQTGPVPGGGEDAVGELRLRLGADKVVVWTDDDRLVGVRDDARFELPGDYATAHADHLSIGRRVFDDDGVAVCPDLQLGEFWVITDVVDDDGSTVVFAEDRRFLIFDPGPDGTPLPRRSVRCDTGTVTDLEATATVSWDGETVVERRTIGGGRVVVVEWGLGDTPVLVTNEGGDVLIASEDLAFDHRFSTDGATVYFTTYAGTGAALPPVSVSAVDVDSGQRRWRIDLPGYALPLDDRVVIDVVDTSALDNLGLFPGNEVVVVEAATGTELDRFPFTGRLIGLF